MTDLRVVTHTCNLCTQENEVEEAGDCGPPVWAEGNPVSTLPPNEPVVVVTLVRCCLGTGVLQGSLLVIHRVQSRQQRA